MNTRYSQQEKQQHVLAWQASGLSKKAYCQQEGIKIATFYYWLERNNKADPAPGNIRLSSAFLPARLAPANGSVTVQLPGEILISCQIAQLPEVVRVLRAC